jgi:hypothetical protein
MMCVGRRLTVHSRGRDGDNRCHSQHTGAEGLPETDEVAHDDATKEEDLKTQSSMRRRVKLIRGPQ